MGIHILIRSRVDDKLDPTKPEALLYESRNDGTLKLVAVEYVVLARGRPAERSSGRSSTANPATRFRQPPSRRCTPGCGSPTRPRERDLRRLEYAGHLLRRRTRCTTHILALAFTTAVFTSVAVAAAPAHRHDMSPASGAAASQKLAAELALGRLATAKYATGDVGHRRVAEARVAACARPAGDAKYATNLALAKKNGYGVITQMIPDMGWHFMNPKITTFDIKKPPILVYGKRGSSWQLVAFEWVFPKKPAKAPLPGATYGSFGAACHYKDGTFVFQASQDSCDDEPAEGSAFNFWHPDLVTLHVWPWYPNPSGVFSGMNPLMRPFNGG